MYSSIRGFLELLKREGGARPTLHTFPAFHPIHTCSAGASFGRVLQKNTKTKKFLARTQFSSLPSAALSWGLLKPCWSPSPPAERSGGCCYQVTLPSSSPNQYFNFPSSWGLYLAMKRRKFCNTILKIPYTRKGRGGVETHITYI